MARIEDQTIYIEHINQVGNLDRLFDVAEGIVNGAEESDSDMVEVASLHTDGKYHIDNPVTGNQGFIVAPKLLHGFLKMRYRMLEDLGGPNTGYTNFDLSDFIDMCGQVAAGNLDIERGEIMCIWLVNKVDGLSKAVMLSGSIVLGNTGPIIQWYIEKFNVEERHNG